MNRYADSELAECGKRAGGRGIGGGFYPGSWSIGGMEAGRRGWGAGEKG